MDREYGKLKNKKPPPIKERIERMSGKGMREERSHSAFLRPVNPTSRIDRAVGSLVFFLTNFGRTLTTKFRFLPLSVCFDIGKFHESETVPTSSLIRSSSPRLLLHSTKGQRGSSSSLLLVAAFLQRDLVYPLGAGVFVFTSLWRVKLRRAARERRTSGNDDVSNAVTRGSPAFRRLRTLSRFGRVVLSFPSSCPSLPIDLAITPQRRRRSWNSHGRRIGGVGL